MTQKTYKIPISYKDKNNEDQQTVVIFKIPIKAGDTSLAVQMIKYFLGLGDLATTNSQFDAIMENAVVGFQEDNRARIYEVGEYGYSSDALVENVQGSEADQSIAEELLGGASINIDLPGGFMTERGQIGDPTYKVMIELGLKSAISELASSSAFQNLLNSGENVNPNDAFKTVTGEQQAPKFTSDGKMIQYDYLTNITRQHVTTQGYDDALEYLYDNPEILQTFFREAVQKVFEFYGKEEVWTIDGADRTFIPIVSPLQDAIDDPDQPRRLYEEILLYQRKVPQVGEVQSDSLTFDEDAGETGRLDADVSSGGFRKGQTFRFTINALSLEEQLNGSEVDVLFGQSLQFGAKPMFAGIVDVINPAARPNSPYTIRVEIRRDMFNQIRGGSGAATFGGTVDVTDPENWKKAKAGFDAAKNFVENDLKKPFSADFWKRQGSALKSGAKKWATGKAMEAEKAAKDALRNTWNKAKTGQAGSTQKQRDQATEEAINAAKEMENVLVSPATYNLSELRENMAELSEGIRLFTEDLKRFEEENKPKPRGDKPYDRFSKTPPPKPPIVPSINPDLEAKRLDNLLNVLEGFLDKNGWTTHVGPKSEDKIQIYFDEVTAEVEQPIPVDSSLEPAIETPQKVETPEKVEKVVGHRIYKIVYIENTDTDGMREELTVGTTDFTSVSPFIYPATVSYLFALNNNGEDTPEILDYIGPDPCDDILLIPPAIFFSRFHYPTPSFTFRKGKKEGINIGLDFDKKGIKAAQKHIDEQLMLAEKSIENLMESTFFEQKGKIIKTSDVYPKFGELACNIEDMWKDFLNRWDPQLILCDYKKCVPGLEDLNFNKKFKFNIPTLPRLPTFNPMDFVLPQLKIALADIIMSFVCEFIKNILEAISYPDCVDALQYGAALLSELNQKNKDNPFADAQQKADLATKAADVLNNLGIPQDVLFGESDSSIEALFDAISLVLRPSELCDLLEGEASDGVLRVVLNVVKSSNSQLKTQLQTLAQISEFFRVLGQVVDPFLCDRLREISEVIVADALCEERSGIDSLRQRLEEAGISSSEIAREMKAAKGRRDALRKIAKDGNFDSLLPGNLPSELAAKQMPGPYSNPHHDRLAKIGLESILANTKNIFSLEIAGFPDSMVDRNQTLISPGDPGFNSMDYLYFKYYSAQIKNLENNLPARKAGKIMPISKALTSFPLLIQLYTLMESIEIPQEEWPYLRFFFEDNSAEEFILLDPESSEPDAEKAEEFSKLVEQYVSEYVVKYTTETPTVFSGLRDVVSQDITTLSRKTTATTGSPYREFHVRVLTETAEFQPENIDSKSNVASRVSAGYSDMPFIPSQIKDCYRVSYSVHLAENNFETAYFNKVYKDNLPAEYVAARKESVDIKSDEHKDKLLRPGGFADLYISGLKKVSDNKSQTNLDAYESDSVRNHISGFIKGSGGLQLDKNGDGEITGTERLVYLLNLIAQTSETRQDGFSIYEGFSDSFNFHISDLVKNSKYFSYDEMYQLQLDISQEFKVEPSLDGKPCYIPNPKLLDFDLIVEEFLNSYKQETEKPENDPQFRDFSKPGPFQTSTASGLFGLYVKFSTLEIVLKSMFLFSNFGPNGVFENQFMIDYVVNYVKNDIEQILISDTLRSQVMSMVKEITKMEDGDKALTALILQHVDTSSIEKFISKMFESKYTSFNEKVRNEIAENCKEVPSIDNYPKLLIQENPFTIAERGSTLEELRQWIENEREINDTSYIQEEFELRAELVDQERRAELLEEASNNMSAWSVNRNAWAQQARRHRQRAREISNQLQFSPTIQERMDSITSRQGQALEFVNNVKNGFKQMPVSAVIPNIYESFAFEGYSEELIQKKINSGHFWMERFYRIKNFPEFFRIYNELYLAVESEPLLQNMLNIGLDPSASLYSEYISPTDMEHLLLGSEDTNTRLEVLESLEENLERNRIENDFVRKFYLRMITNFFAGRPNTGEDYGDSGARRVWHSGRCYYSKAFRMMIDIGFAAKAPEGAITADQMPTVQSGGMPFGFVANIAGYGINWGEPSPRTLNEDETIEPLSEDVILSELDYAYRSGQVSKEQLIERVLFIIDDVNTLANGQFDHARTMMRTWNNNIVGPTVEENIPLQFAGVGAIQSWPDHWQNQWSKIGAYKWLAKWFVFDQEQYDHDPAYVYVNIPRRRKAELIVECLINMLEIIHNWPTNNDRVSTDTTTRTRVHWRDDPMMPRGSGYYNNAKDLFEEISRSPRSIDYARTWYGSEAMFDNLSDTLRGELDSMHLDILPGGNSAHRVNGSPLYVSDYLREVNGEPLDPENPEHHGKIRQDRLLDYYVSKTYVPILDERQLSLSKSTSGALSIMKPMEWVQDNGNLNVPVNDFYTDVIVPKQQELYDFLKNNLQIGGRLMMGQKARREYEKPATPESATSSTLTSIGVMETKPEDIFEDFLPRRDLGYSVDDASNRTIGLDSDKSLFNRKKCFLAYADKHPLNSAESPTNLDYRSSFYNVATSHAAYSVMSAGQADIDNSVDIFDEDVQNALVYSIPIHEHIEDLGCLDDVYAETHSEVFFPMEFESNVSEGESPVQTEFLNMEKRRDMIKNRIYALNENKIVKSLLSLGDVDPDLKSRPLDRSKTMHPANVAMGILLPLDRFVGIHTLQSSIVFDKFRQEDGLLRATKLSCLASMDAVASAHDVTKDKDPQLKVNESLTEMLGNILGDLWVMFYKALQKLIEQSYARLVRTIGEKADPGYRDMRTGYLNDPCEMKTGLQTELLGGPLLFDDYSGNLEYGFGKKDGKKYYVPINVLPIDILQSAFSPSGAIKVSKHLAGLIRDEKRRYGYPVGPFGRLALSSPQLISEQLSNMKQEKQCQDPGAPEPEGLCDDKEGEDTE